MNIGLTILKGELAKTELDYEKTLYEMKVYPNEYSSECLKWLSDRIVQLKKCIELLNQIEQ